jgi:hypothetical protein
VPTPYYLIRAKLGRADEHLETLDKRIQGFLDTKPYRGVPDIDAEAGQSLIRAQVLREPPVIEWGLLIGDVLHNLRSALDHLAWRLGGDPPPNEGTSEFPIFWDKTAFRTNGINKVVGVPDHPLAIIEDLQPYHRGNTAKNHPLWRLYLLSNFDKHRLLHVSGAVVKTASYMVEAPAGSTSDFEAIRLGPFEDGAVIATWPLNPEVDVARPKVNMPFNFSFDIAFDETGPGRGEPVRDTLQRCRSHIGNVAFSRLAPWLF